MKKWIHAVVWISVMLSAGCSRKEPPVLLLYHGGREYQILDRGSTVSNGELTYFVRYYSQDIRNESVLQAERADLCTIIARHMGTQIHHSVMITAVEQKRRVLGLLNPRSLTERLSMQEVMKYRDGKIE